MKVSEVISALAEFDGSTELDSDMSISQLLLFNKIKNKRIHLVSTFPEEGIPVSELLDDDELLEFISVITDSFADSSDINAELANYIKEGPYDILADKCNLIAK